MSVTIRPAEPDDLQEILRLWADADAEPTTTDDLDALRTLQATDPEACLVAVDDGVIVGSVVAAWDGWRGHLHRLAVAPDRRREGIARALINEAERRLEARGARRVAVITVDGEAAAAALWEAAGYAAQTARTRHVKNLG